MSDEGGTIRDLHGGRVVGKTENLSRTFAEAVTKAGPPCLIVGPTEGVDRLDPYLPEWVERLVDDDTPRGIVYAFSMTLAEWNSGGGSIEQRAVDPDPRPWRRR